MSEAKERLDRAERKMEFWGRAVQIGVCLVIVTNLIWVISLVLRW